MSNRTITVAAIQTSYGPDMKANIDKTAAFVREAARAGAQVVLPSELFQGIYFCTQAGPEVVRDGASRRGAPVRARAAEARARAWRRHPHLVLREGRPALLQQRRDRGRRAARSSASIARATSPTVPATRRSTTSVPATPASRRGRRKPARSASASAGTSGTRRPRAPWCSRAPRSCSIRRPSARSPTTRRSTPTRSGSARCRATPSPTRCRSSPPTASGSRTTTA